MAERKSVNKYYPPDWDPSKGSVNTYVGQHPLRDRAKKLGQGILVIRFELPYNIWCGGCGAHVGMGVRYNAEKSKTGNYYSTPIYKFRMKCHLCDNYFTIQTDPKNHDYVILEGARRKEQRWDPKENGQIVPEDKATQKKMATDAMFKLEHKSDDVDKGKKVLSNLGMLELRRDEWKDDYILNKIARNKFREEKKCITADEASDNALLAKSSLEIPLLKETAEDIKLAGLMKYRTLDTYEEKKIQKRKEIESRPLFTSSKNHKGETPDNKNKLDIIKTQLKNSKNKLPSPFDSVKTTGKHTYCNKAAIGIVQKSKPSYSGFVVKKDHYIATKLNEVTHEEGSFLPHNEIASTAINEMCTIDGIDVNHLKHSGRNVTHTKPVNSESDFETVEDVMEVNKERTDFPEIDDSIRNIEDEHFSENCVNNNEQPMLTKPHPNNARTDKTHHAGDLDRTGHTNIINPLNQSTTDTVSEKLEQREDGQNMFEQESKTNQQSDAIQSTSGLSLVSMYDNSDTDSSCG